MKHACALAVVFTVIICGIAAAPDGSRESLEHGLGINPGQQPNPSSNELNDLIEGQHTDGSNGQSRPSDPRLFDRASQETQHPEDFNGPSPQYLAALNEISREQEGRLPSRGHDPNALPQSTSAYPAPNDGHQSYPTSQLQDHQSNNALVEAERENALHGHTYPESDYGNQGTLPEQELQELLHEQNSNGLLNRLQGMPSQLVSTLGGIIPDQNSLLNQLQGMPSQVASTLQGFMPGQNGVGQNGAAPNGAAQNGASPTDTQQDSSPFGFLTSMLPFGQNSNGGSGPKEDTTFYHLGKAFDSLLKLKLMK